VPERKSVGSLPRKHIIHLASLLLLMVIQIKMTTTRQTFFGNISGMHYFLSYDKGYNF
jgi:hypothetical protein